MRSSALRCVEYRRAPWAAIRYWIRLQQPRARRMLGQTVHALDPFDAVGGTASFNPLEARWVASRHISATRLKLLSRWERWIERLFPRRVRAVAPPADGAQAFSLSVRVILLAITCGAIGSVGAAAFKGGLSLTETLLHGKSGHLVEAAQGLSWWYRLLFPCVGGVIAGAILQLGNRWSALAQNTDYLEVIALGKRPVNVRSSLVRSFSSMLSVASGGSIGREGAMVQVSAVTGHVISRIFRSGDDEYRLLVACAAAAGLATAYNAPLAGASSSARSRSARRRFHGWSPCFWPPSPATPLHSRFSAQRLCSAQPP
jgi:hypothetical protein